MLPHLSAIQTGLETCGSDPGLIIEKWEVFEDLDKWFERARACPERIQYLAAEAA